MMHVEITDLEEIDVTQVDFNQKAAITFEALPDEVFTGTITNIASMTLSGIGGFNYTVELSLNRLHPKLRWGMTAFVDLNLDN
jgi:hypothetical protein